DVPLVRMPHVALGAGETGPGVGSGSRVVAPPADGVASVVPVWTGRLLHQDESGLGVVAHLGDVLDGRAGRRTRRVEGDRHVRAEGPPAGIHGPVRGDRSVPDIHRGAGDHPALDQAGWAGSRVDLIPPLLRTGPSGHRMRAPNGVAGPVQWISGGHRV